MLIRARTAIDDCAAHLDESNAWNTQIESYLTQHVLVILCAEVQQHIYSLLDQRIAQSQDGSLNRFAIATGRKCLRSVGKSEVSGFLAYFGPGVKEYFNQLLDDRLVTIYNNAVSVRHDVAHNNGSQVTYRELSLIYEAAVAFISAIDKTLEFTLP